VPSMSIETATQNGKAVVRIIAQNSSEETAASWDADAAETQQTSLVTAACRSIGLRLDTTIHRERDASGRYVIQVEFHSA
jgi:hypothetical protein